MISSLSVRLSRRFASCLEGATSDHALSIKVFTTACILPRRHIPIKVFMVKAFANIAFCIEGATPNKLLSFKALTNNCVQPRRRNTERSFVGHTPFFASCLEGAKPTHLVGRNLYDYLPLALKAQSPNIVSSVRSSRIFASASKAHRRATFRR